MPKAESGNFYVCHPFLLTDNRQLAGSNNNNLWFAYDRNGSLRNLEIAISIDAGKATLKDNAPLFDTSRVRPNGLTTMEFVASLSDDSRFVGRQHIVWLGQAQKAYPRVLSMTAKEAFFEGIDEHPRRSLTGAEVTGYIDPNIQSLAYMANLYVLSDYRNQSIAENLTAYALDYHRGFADKPLTYFALSEHQAVAKIYQKLGGGVLSADGFLRIFWTAGEHQPNELWGTAWLYALAESNMNLTVFIDPATRNWNAADAGYIMIFNDNASNTPLLTLTVDSDYGGGLYPRKAQTLGFFSPRATKNQMLECLHLLAPIMRNAWYNIFQIKNPAILPMERARAEDYVNYKYDPLTQSLKPIASKQIPYAVAK